MRSQAITIISSGTVNTILMKPGNSKQGIPGNIIMLCSLVSLRVNSKHDDIFGKFFKSIPIIMYIAPFGMIGLSPEMSFKRL